MEVFARRIIGRLRGRGVMVAIDLLLSNEESVERPQSAVRQIQKGPKDRQPAVLVVFVDFNLVLINCSSLQNIIGDSDLGKSSAETFVIVVVAISLTLIALRAVGN